MMGRGIVLALSLSFASAASAQVDPHAIVAPVIASEARIHSTLPRLCVDPTAFAAFDSVRERLRQLPGMTVSGGHKDRVEKEMRDELTSGAYDWQHPATKPGMRWENSPLSPQEAAPLTAAAAALVRNDSSAPVSVIDAGALPPPLAYGRSSGCPTLSISAPEEQGDIAFVETGYHTEGLFGFGQLYALRRDGGGWRIVAVADLWVG